MVEKLQTEPVDFVFEVCFEACNKVGGIYTVVSSKAKRMKENFKNFIIIGPDYREKQNQEFKEKRTPKKFETIFSKLEKEGIKCRFGTWLIDGEPDTILIETKNYAYALDGLKKEYWEKFKIDSLNAGWDFFEPMLWSTAAGKLIEYFEQENSDDKIIAHFHEWIAGFGLLLLKIANSNAKTVFTTHATMLGRTISGTGKRLYDILDEINPEEEAKNHGVIDKFSTERACANNSDIFTTVSEITGLEAEKILGRKPEPIVFNGLDLREFPEKDELSKIRTETRDLIIEVLESATSIKLKEEIDNTRIFFTSGRYEFRNKGIDLFIESLGKMNSELKNSDCNKKVIALFLIPNGWTEINKELQENIIKIRENREVFFEEKKNRILCTHNLTNPDDNIVNALNNENLTGEDSRIIPLVIPIYLGKEDQFFNKDYYEIAAGCDAGVFASYYEPWGYTPPESLAVAVPTITSDLAGFGRYIKNINKQGEYMGVINRFDNDNKSIDELKYFLWNIVNKDINFDDRFASCRDIVNNTEWKDFIEKYLEAYKLATSNSKNK